mmetsp:Transcript_41481/g.75159  ORF Transcript_41481/g.75159 Transcript_41481/m.75159 type:complete len:101 (-) Transcript_41481:125-427(-)
MHTASGVPQHCQWRTAGSSWAGFGCPVAAKAVVAGCHPVRYEYTQVNYDDDDDEEDDDDDEEEDEEDDDAPPDQCYDRYWSLKHKRWYYVNHETGRGKLG